MTANRSTAQAAPEELQRLQHLVSQNPLANWINLKLDQLGCGQVVGRMLVEQKHLAPNNYLHAAVLVALADILCGTASMYSLPQSAQSFTTAELKSNFLSTLRQGEIICKAQARHLGSKTQVWDAEIVDPQKDKALALFRCTQIVLY